MRVPLSWLKEFVDITISPTELAYRLTVAGAEVSKVEYIGVAPPPLSRATHVLLPTHALHPAGQAGQAGEGPGVGVHRIVTGAPNIFHLNGQGKLANGPKVVFAMEGAQLYDGHAEGQKLMTLKASKIRGVPSNAMVCSEKELGLSEEHEGIILLDPDAPVGTPLADYWGDVVLHVEILPNIARCQSIIGVAREVTALTGAPFKGEDAGKLNTNLQLLIIKDSSDWLKVRIEAPDLCPRFSATLARDITIGPSPEWMQRRLKLTGVRAINNIVDITNYVMMESGKPIHAFDYDKLLQRTADGRRQTANGGQQPRRSAQTGSAVSGQIPTIIIRRATDGEHITTLDGVDRALTNDMVMVADTTGSVGVGGIMGGATTEIDEHTRNVLIESANWHFINNRKTAQALKLPSEATARFGRGVPDASTIPSAMRAADLIRQLAGGAVAPELIDVYPNPKPPTIIPFNTSEIKRLLGIEVPVERVTAILESLDFKVQTADRRPPTDMGVSGQSAAVVLEITVPDHRLDVSIPADIVEEVARIIGYDQIPATLMRDELPPQRRNVALEVEDHIRDILVGAGLQEVISYPLTTIERQALLYPDPSQADLDLASYVMIANPITPEKKVMRHTLLASLLDTLRETLRHRERALLFEIGRAYLPQAGSVLPTEHTRLCIALGGAREPYSWLASSPAARGRERERLLDFFDLKGIVDVLAQKLNLANVQFTPSEHPTFHPARAATLSAGGEPIGTFGEAHPRVREQFGLEGTVGLAEFDVSGMMRQMQPIKFRKQSRFPSIREDIALIVDEDTPAAHVEALIRDAGGSTLRSVTLFDLYRGEQVGAGRKSLAYALTYQHDERTLTDDEAAKIRGRIIKKLRDAIGAELRV